LQYNIEVRDLARQDFTFFMHRAPNHLRQANVNQEFLLMAKEKGTRGQPVQPERVDKDGPYPMMCKEGKGVRNFACPNYDGCLDRAAKGMWSGFTCRECCSYVQKEEEPQS
jgi:hypothetical protein